MPEIINNASLQSYNTFGFDVQAKHLTILHTLEDFQCLRKQAIYQNSKILFLGGGSNILFREDFEGLVVVNRIDGITYDRSPNTTAVRVKVGGGVSWHGLVLQTIEEGLGGLENLSLIPGTVGAAPMQNIGAYGVEIKDVFTSLEAINLSTGALEVFEKEACQFGYRESIFKHSLKGKFLIVSVTFTLTEATAHQPSVEYGAIKEVLEQKAISSPTIKEVSDAVIAIRTAKLPNPQDIGNSGSFFKNPIVSMDQYDLLKQSFADMPAYHLPDNTVKLAAGWLIEQAGWKGYQENGVGVHDKQALVLVNLGQGSGRAVSELAIKIQDSVQSKFGVELIPEVNFI